ncbi:MAG: replication initiation protein [Candidatus Poribacteria bacterium]|nr:replication initiation protein [Candidatus Poribacteria bacterium]
MTKPAIEEINELTNFLIEVEQKRVGRKIGELKFKISRLKELPTLEPKQETTEPTQASLFVDMEELPAIAVKLVQAGVAQKEALRIANQEWDVVDAVALPEGREDFAEYVEEKITLARHATGVKNAGGFIVKAIQENYQDPELQKRLQVKKEKEKEEMLASLRREMVEKKNALIRRAVRANPELLEQAAERITSSFVNDFLMEYDSVKDAYAVGGLVAGEINIILGEEFCADLIAPVIAAYEAEKERIEG